MADEAPVVSAKLLRKAVRSRVPYLEAHHAECTMKQIRRLLEADLGLPPKALDGEPHKGAITQLVEEVMRLLLTNIAEAESEPPALKAKVGVSERALKLKALLKGATMSVPPNIYAKARGDEETLCSLLVALLATEGLSEGSTPFDCGKVRRRKESARELEGIDAGNIVATEGRSRRAAAAVHAFIPPPDKPAAAKAHKKHAAPSPGTAHPAAKKARGAASIADWADDDDA